MTRKVVVVAVLVGEIRRIVLGAKVSKASVCSATARVKKRSREHTQTPTRIIS